MKILLDLQGCQSASRMRGIGRYCNALARGIARNAGDHELWVLLNDRFSETVMPIRTQLATNIPPERIVVFSTPGPVAEGDPANQARARAAELIREHAVAALAPDVVHVGSLFEGFHDDAVTSVGALSNHVPTAVSLYDLIPLRNPTVNLTNPVYRDYYARKIESLKRADAVLAISKTVVAEGIELLHLPRERLTNISAGIDDCFSPGVPSEIAGDILRVRFGLVRPFAMYLGVIEPRKQFEGLIRAWARVPERIRRTHQLLLIAQEPETEHKRLRNLAALKGLADGDVRIIGRVNDEDLVSLYRLCRLFVFPSLQEGLGLPVLEAMACGAVVVASNASSIPEVVGCADALFSPEDVDDIARLIVRGLSDENFRGAFLAHARQQCARFSWDASARRTIAVLEAIAAKRQRVVPEKAYSALIDRLTALPQPLVETEWRGIAQAIAENLPPPETPRLFVDISELAERDVRTGIQRVVRAVLLQLLEAPPAGFRVEPVRFDRATDRYRFARRYIARMRGAPSAEEGEDELFEAWRGDVFLGLDLVADRLPIAAPWLAQQRRRGVQLAFVAYDTLPLRHPEWWPEGMGGVFERWAELLACEADVVLGISRAVGEEFGAWVRARGIARTPRLGWFHPGADMRNSLATGGLPADAADTLAAIGRAPAFLVVGTIEPRKGHAQAIAAFELLWREGVAAHLVIVGRAGWMVEPLIARLRIHPERHKRLFWLEGISDEYLEALYRASDALLAPSEGEGFGLPLIEAAHYGLPIIARELPVFREVAGDRATYFSGTKPNDMAAVIRRWLIAPAAAPQSSGLLCLTWAESTAQLCRALQLPEAPCRSVSRHVA